MSNLRKQFEKLAEAFGKYQETLQGDEVDMLLVEMAETITKAEEEKRSVRINFNSEESITILTSAGDFEIQELVDKFELTDDYLSDDWDDKNFEDFLKENGLEFDKIDEDFDIIEMNQI
jgi:hypothetical protein